jgi:hypothetical protein
VTTQATDAAPAPPPPIVQEALAQQALRAAELLVLERAAAAAVAGPLRAQLVTIQRAAIRAWIAAFGSTGAPGDPIRAAAIVADVRGRLARVDTSSAAALQDYARRAVNLGAAQAIRDTGTTLTVDELAPAVDDVTARIVAGLQQDVRGRLAAAENALGTAGDGGFADIDAAVAKARRGTATAERSAVSAVHGGATAGRAAVADAIGVDMLWLAEPDACTTCLGFAGRLAPAGQPFDLAHAATFTDKPHLWPPGPLEHPPAHPHCRCQAVPYLGHAPGAPDPSLPEALQREAQRSILRGWSLPTESGPERVRAARKLLARNPKAPASVKAYSRRAVVAGRFPTRAVLHRGAGGVKTKP